MPAPPIISNGQREARGQAISRGRELHPASSCHSSHGKGHDYRDRWRIGAIRVTFTMMGEGNERKNSGKRRNSSKVFKRMGLHLTPAALLSPLPMPSLHLSPQALEGLMHICLGKI